MTNTSNKRSRTLVLNTGIIFIFLLCSSTIWAENTPEHADLTWSDYPSTCLGCHEKEYTEVFYSTHYQWQGAAPDMVNNPDIPQGKLFNGVNSYCINILGNWAVCGTCHAGRGQTPDSPDAGMENIDCLMCHNVEYATQRKRLSDGSMGVMTGTNSMVRQIDKPTRANCLSCHATAGGGDGVKRGDLSLALVDTASEDFDVHMNTGEDNLSCQRCHEIEQHRVIGKGSDLRPTDDLSRGSELNCIDCHDHHGTTGEIGRHTGRVACQTCHIPVYAKVPTETHRDWRLHHDQVDADTCSAQTPCPGHPLTVKESNLIPKYRFWNRKSDNTLLYDDASKTFDVGKGTYPTSRPLGTIQDGKLYAFKYKTADQPKTKDDNRLIALDTFVYLKGTGNVTDAVKAGLINMGYPANTPYEWIVTDTYQMLNHGVGRGDDALRCSDCHGNTQQIDLEALGYVLKDDEGVVCFQCHGQKEAVGYNSLHNKHVSDKGYDCSWCHDFSRPERNLTLPPHCPGDTDMDKDTDGLDVFRVASGQTDVTIMEVAEGFGCIIE